MVHMYELYMTPLQVNGTAHVTARHRRTSAAQNILEDTGRCHSGLSTNTRSMRRTRQRAAKQVVVTRLRKGVFPAMLVVRGLLVLQMSKEAESKGRTMAEAA